MPALRLTSRGEVMPVDVAPGESVLFDGYKSSSCEIEDKQYKVVSVANCLAKW